MIDLRSDTVTRPTDAMRQAARDAPVGDAKLGDDPTVERLEDRVADLLGTDAGCYLPSGTMANQVACRVHADRGSEVVVDAKSHVYNSEYAGLAAMSGLQPRPVDAERGVPGPAAIRTAASANYKSETALLVLENTHNRRGGLAVDPERLAEAATAAREAGLAVHLDGARLWNAAVARDCDLAAFGRPVDSAMVSLSKGLGAPVGSVLAGSEAFVEDAAETRNAFGGGMRQAGIVAGPALAALDSFDHLATDHENAAALAAGLDAVDGLTVQTPETNIVVASVERADVTAESFQERLAAEDVLVSTFPGGTVRLCTHRDVDADDVARAVDVAAEIADDWG